MGYQAHALRLLKSQLPPETGLLGFVGGPLTLYFYAVLEAIRRKMSAGFAQAGIRNGLFQAFYEILNSSRSQYDRSGGGRREPLPCSILAPVKCLWPYDESSFR